MSFSQFEYISTLQYRIKSLERRIEAFESGSLYKQMQEDYQKLLRREELRIHKLEVQLGDANARNVSIRRMWLDSQEEIWLEYSRALELKEKENRKLRERILEVERQRDAALDKVTAQRHELYAVKTELEEEKGKNLELTAQLNRDYENSSKPSSQSVNHKKITNNREKSGRKPGGQPGHKGHGRKKHEPTSPVVKLEAPKEVLDDPGFRKTGKTIVKDLVGIHLVIDVTRYQADEYYNSQTGERKHAEFPVGVVDDVNYDGTIKAFLYLLNNDCDISIDKARGFLFNLSGGELNISKGMVSNLNKQFSDLTEDQRKKWFMELLRNPVLHMDFTNARCDGRSAQVAVVASPDGLTQYYGRDHKGHEGIKGTPIETYHGIIVHDHDISFYKYGSDHQECTTHILRYLKNAMENEPGRTWAGKMRSLLQEMIHYRNSLGTEGDLDAAVVENFEKRYREIIEIAREEYLDDPPSEYYKDGYNLFSRMEKYMHNHLLFLHDKRVPHNNNLSERQARKVKRKISQVMTYRSSESLGYFCDGLGVLVSMREENPGSLYTNVSEIFNKTHRWTD